MGQREVEIVRSMYAAFHGGDAAGALEHFDPDVVVDATTRVDIGIGHGRDELGRIIGGWTAAFDEWQEEIEEIRDLGDRVLAVATQRGRGRDSGVEIETRYAVLYEVRGERITHMALHTDPESALEAARPGG